MGYFQQSPISRGFHDTVLHTELEIMYEFVKSTQKIMTVSPSFDL